MRGTTRATHLRKFLTDRAGSITGCKCIAEASPLRLQPRRGFEMGKCRKSLTGLLCSAPLSGKGLNDIAAGVARVDRHDGDICRTISEHDVTALVRRRRRHRCSEGIDLSKYQRCIRRAARQERAAADHRNKPSNSHFQPPVSPYPCRRSTQSRLTIRASFAAVLACFSVRTTKTA
jgi:hypothetical protein